MNARKSLLIVLNNTMGGFVGIVGLYFIGQYLAPASLGMVAFAMSLAAMAGSLASLGVAQAHVKRVSEGQDLAACVGTFRRVKGILSLVFLGGLLLCAAAWEHWKGFTNATTLAVVTVLVANGALQQFRATFVTTFQGLRRTALSQTVQMAEYLTRVPAVVLVAVLAGGAAGHGGPLGSLPGRLAGAFGIVGAWSPERQALLLAGTWLAGQAASTVVGAWLYRRQGLPWGRFDMDLLRSYLRFAGPLALLGLVSTFAQQADTLMVGYFWNATETGYYYAAQRFLRFIDVVPLAVGTLFFPLISELAGRRETAAVHEVARTTQRLLGLVYLPVAMLVMVFRDDVVRIFVGNPYLPAGAILLWLVAFTVLRSFATVSQGILQGYDLPRTVARLGILSMALNVALNLVFIPKSLLGIPMLGLKAEGAAMATAIAQAVAFLLTLGGSRKASGSAHFGWFALRQLFAAAAGAAAVWGLREALYGDALLRIWDVAALGLAGLLADAAVLVLLRELTRKDTLFLLDLAHPGRMWRYVREELAGRGPDRK